MTMGSRSMLFADTTDFPDKTSRLQFIPKTESLANLESLGNGHLRTALAAEVPSSWPPHIVEPPAENVSGWKSSYLIHSGPNGNGAVVVGLAGHKKWQAEYRTLQIGAVLVPEYHGQRLGEEVVAALGKWGLSQSGIDRVICDIPADHSASAKSLERAGFTKAVETPAAGFVRFELTKSS